MRHVDDECEVRTAAVHPKSGVLPHTPSGGGGGGGGGVTPIHIKIS